MGSYSAETNEFSIIGCWNADAYPEWPGYLLRYRADYQRFEFYVEATGGSSTTWSANNSCTRASMATATPLVVGATWAEDGYSRIFNPDGTTATGSASSGPLSEYTKNVYLGATPHNAADQWVDYMHFIYVWGRGITVDVVNEIRRDPYQILVPA